MFRLFVVSFTYGKCSLTLDHRPLPNRFRPTYSPARPVRRLSVYPALARGAGCQLRRGKYSGRCHNIGNKLPPTERTQTLALRQNMARFTINSGLSKENSGTKKLTPYSQNELLWRAARLSLLFLSHRWKLSNGCFGPTNDATSAMGRSLPAPLIYRSSSSSSDQANSVKS